METSVIMTNEQPPGHYVRRNPDRQTVRILWVNPYSSHYYVGVSISDPGWVDPAQPDQVWVWRNDPEPRNLLLAERIDDAGQALLRIQNWLAEHKLIDAKRYDLRWDGGTPPSDVLADELAWQHAPSVGVALAREIMCYDEVTDAEKQFFLRWVDYYDQEEPDVI